MQFLAQGLPSLPLDPGVGICRVCARCSRVAALPRCTGRALSSAVPVSLRAAGTQVPRGSVAVPAAGGNRRAVPGRHVPLSPGASDAAGVAQPCCRALLPAAIAACLHLPAALELLWVGGQRAAGMDGSRGAVAVAFSWLVTGRRFCLCCRAAVIRGREPKCEGVGLKLQSSGIALAFWYLRRLRDCGAAALARLDAGVAKDIDWTWLLEGKLGEVGGTCGP